MTNHSQTILPAVAVIEIDPLFNITQRKNGCFIISSPSVDRNRFVLLPHGAWRKLQVKAAPSGWQSRVWGTQYHRADASIPDHVKTPHPPQF